MGGRGKHTAAAGGGDKWGGGNNFVSRIGVFV